MVCNTWRELRDRRQGCLAGKLCAELFQVTPQQPPLHSQSPIGSSSLPVDRLPPPGTSRDRCHRRQGHATLLELSTTLT